MTLLRVVLALCAALVVSACYPPVTSHPVGTTVGIKLDPELVGTWRGVDTEKRPNFFHFLKTEDGSLTVLMIVGDARSQDWLVATATSAHFDGYGILNARLTLENGKLSTDMPGGTVPVLYRLRGHDTIELALPDETKVKAAIRSGAVKGSVGEGESGDATITAEPAALDKFFGSKAGVAIFATPFVTLHRLN